MKRFVSTLLLLVIVGGLPGCITLHSDYPEVHYYRLEQKPSILEIPATPGSLLMRKFDISGEYDSEYLLKVRGGVEVERYYYHRWIDPPADMFSNFLVERFLLKGAFADGIVRSGSRILPAYILEGRILEMTAYNERTDGPDRRFVLIRIHASLLAYRQGALEYPILLQKIYEKRVERKAEDIRQVPEAFSMAVSELCDELMLDIHNAVSNR